MRRRQTDWEHRLLAYIDRTHLTPFTWGGQDCALWAAGAIDAMCDTTITRALNAYYADADGAIAWLNERGWPTLREALLSILDHPQQVKLMHAQRGDVVFLPTTDDGWTRGALMIVTGEHVMGPGTHGLRAVPLLALTRAKLGAEAYRV